MTEQEIEEYFQSIHPTPLTKEEIAECEQLAYAQAIDEYSRYKKIDLIHLVLELYKRSARQAQQIVDLENLL